MTARAASARRAGILYFAFSIIAIVGEFLLPRFIVFDDAAQTARNIAGADLMYRIHLFTSLVTLVIFIFLAATLYGLFSDVSRPLARQMVLLVTVGIAVALSNLIIEFAPLVFLSGAGYLTVFTKPQIEALALAFLRLHANGSTVVIGFWGLWLFPFGLLVIKSRFFPRILGALLLIAGSAYVISSFTAIVLPAQRHLVSMFVTPLYIGEVPIIFWMMIKGAGEPIPAH